MAIVQKKMNRSGQLLKLAEILCQINANSKEQVDVLLRVHFLLTSICAIVLCPRDLLDVSDTTTHDAEHLLVVLLKSLHAFRRNTPEKLVSVSLIPLTQTNIDLVYIGLNYGCKDDLIVNICHMMSHLVHSHMFIQCTYIWPLTTPMCDLDLYCMNLNFEHDIPLCNDKYFPIMTNICMKVYKYPSTHIGHMLRTKLYVPVPLSQGRHKQLIF